MCNNRPLNAGKPQAPSPFSQAVDLFGDSYRVSIWKTHVIPLQSLR